MTPSLPTLSIAWAMMVPMVESLLALMVPTCSIDLPSTGLESFRSSSVTASTACWMPRWICIGLAPAVTFFTPSR